MRKNRQAFLLLIFLTTCFFNGYSQEQAEEREYYNKEDNAVCFECHGNQFFNVVDEDSGETFRRKMFKGLIIDSVKYYETNHWSFTCTDCHSYDYNTYPHADALHYEPMAACEDCHGGDEAMDKYNFDGIVEEYNKSHHTKLPDYPYTCWSCHDPHSFKMEVRTEEKLVNIVAHDNGMCLQCHGLIGYADLLMQVTPDPMLEIHAWLPGTENHLRHVRCLECHAEINDSVVVAHNIVPKEQAIRSCEECHSSDSRLLHTLYKYQIQEGRMERGFFGGMSTGEIFVIGSNRNRWLNIASLFIMGGMAFVLLLHVFFRIKMK